MKIQVKVFYVVVKVKGKAVPVLFKWAPRHEGVLGEWKYSSKHFWSWY